MAYSHACERAIVLVLGLVTGWIVPVLWFLAIGTVLTAVHRMLSVYLQMREQPSGDTGVRNSPGSKRTSRPGAPVVRGPRVVLESCRHGGRSRVVKASGCGPEDRGFNSHRSPRTPGTTASGVFCCEGWLSIESWSSTIGLAIVRVRFTPIPRGRLSIEAEVEALECSVSVGPVWMKTSRENYLALK